MVRTASCGGDRLRNPNWNEDEEEEDDESKVITHVSLKQQQETGNWTSFSKRSVMQRRNGKSGRLTGGSHRKQDIKHKSFTPQEEELVIQLHAAIGSRWPIIAQQLPGRTEYDVKTLWNSKLRKKLSAMGIDPVTHKPFSQILADYGSIGAFPRARTRFASLSRDLKNATLLKSQQTYLNLNQHPNQLLQYPPKLEQETEQEPEPSSGHDPYPLDLYSQLQAVNLVTDAHTKAEHVPQCHAAIPAYSFPTNQDFAWSDFLLEDAFLPANGECENGEDEGDGTGDKKVNVGDYEGKKGKSILDYDKNGKGFECGGTSNSDSSSFVEAMLESQDEMFSQLSAGFFGEPYYY